MHDLTQSYRKPWASPLSVESRWCRTPLGVILRGRQGGAPAEQPRPGLQLEAIGHNGILAQTDDVAQSLDDMAQAAYY